MGLRMRECRVKTRVTRGREKEREREREREREESEGSVRESATKGVSKC